MVKKFNPKFKIGDSVVIKRASDVTKGHGIIKQTMFVHEWGSVYHLVRYQNGEEQWLKECHLSKPTPKFKRGDTVRCQYNTDPRERRGIIDDVMECKFIMHRPFIEYTVRFETGRVLYLCDNVVFPDKPTKKHSTK